MIEKNIKSAFEFFSIAHNLKKERNHPSEIEFYRGHSNKEWKLMPTINRNCMLDFEEELINEFVRRRPDEFSESNGLFNVIAKMQHYGLHTRLLDITENPAVALYFACCDNFDKDGEIFTFQKSLDEVENNEVANIIAEFYIRFNDSRVDCAIEDYYNYLIGKYNMKNIRKALYYILNGYYCICRPRIIGERILRQAGSFMMVTNKSVIKKEYINNEEVKKRIENLKQYERVSQENIKDSRFLRVIKSVHDYTEAHIKNEQEGYRYIIKAEDKKDIMSQLKTIGIKKSFLFPELNNEGMDVMEEYLSRLF